jgi:predicted glycosyltransferase
METDERAEKLPRAMEGSTEPRRIGGRVGRTMKLLLYAFSWAGHGHVTRVSRLANGLADEPGIQIAIVSDQPAPYWLNETVSFHLIPPLDGDHGGESPQRIRAIEEVGHSVAPNVVLIDHYPFSLRGIDLGPTTLIRAARSIQPTFVGALFRGFVSATPSFKLNGDDEVAAPRSQAMRKALGTQVDRIFIAQPRSRMEAVLGALPLLEEFREQIHFIGFVGPMTRSEEQSDSHRLLAQVGGGSVRYESVVLHMALLIREMCRVGEVATGDFFVGRNTSTDVEAQVRQILASTEITIERWTDHLSDLRARAGIQITMGGYGTCAELPSLATRWIMLPYGDPAEMLTEQMHNAQFMMERGWVDLVVKPGEEVVEVARRFARRPRTEQRVGEKEDLVDYRALHDLLRVSCAGT